VVLIGGEAGIGKTTLVEDLAIDAEEQGCLVLWGHAYDLSVTQPYGPWLEIAAIYPVDSTLPAQPVFITDENALASLGSADRLIAESVNFYQAVARVRPLVLVLDDLHWFNSASLDLLRALGRSIESKHILLLCTYRSDEVHRRHPLYELLPLLTRESLAIRIDVGQLNDEAYRSLIDGRYGLARSDNERLTRYLIDHAEGNPLYAGELLRTLEHDGVVQTSDNGWVFGELGSVRVPPLLREVIDARLKQLAPETYRLLQMGAVIGQAVPVELWRAVSNTIDETLIEALVQGRDAHVLEEALDGTHWRFRHALLREALYEDLVSLRRRALHRQVGEALIQTTNPDPDAVANHFQRAGDRRAAEWLLAAGERAQRAYSWLTAIERFEAALALMTEQETPAGERAVLVYRIARLNRYGDLRRSLRLIREAHQLATEAGERGLAAASLFSDGLFQCSLGEVRAGLAAMIQGLQEFNALSDEDHQRAAELLGPTLTNVGAVGTLVLWLTHAGRFHEAVQLGEGRFTTVVWPQLNPEEEAASAQADGCLGLAIAYAILGQPQPARREIAQARSLYQGVGHHMLLALTTALELICIQLPYSADQGLANLRLLADEGVAAFGRASGARPDTTPANFIALQLLILSGDWDEAVAIATEMYAVELRTSFQRGSGEALARLSMDRGHSALAAKIISDRLPVGPATEPGNDMFWSTLDLQRQAAQIALDADDHPTARAWLEAHDRWLAWSGAVLGRAEGALGWAEYHHANHDAAQAQASAEQAFAHASEPRQPLALFAIHRFLGRLDTEAQQFPEADEHLLESLRLAEACAAPFERALTLLEIAKLRATQGRIDEAKTLLAEVRAICEPLGAKPTLVRVTELEHELEAQGQEPRDD
jgi:tetratricopeptide (TPR) repeat protein